MFPTVRSRPGRGSSSTTTTEAPSKEPAPVLTLVLKRAQSVYDSDKERVHGLRERFDQLKNENLSPEKLKEALKGLNDELDETKVNVSKGIDEIKADVNRAMPDESQFDTQTEEGRQQYKEAAALFLDTVAAVRTATRTWGDVFQSIVEKAKEILRAVGNAMVEAAQAVADVAKKVMKSAYEKVKDFVTWFGEILSSPGVVSALQLAANVTQLA